MATAAAAAEAPKGGGKKKLIIIIAAVLLLVLIGGGAALMLMKKKAPADGEEGGEEAAHEAPAPAAHAPKPGTPPTFVPLDPFTVNLSDKEVDRFAQIGVTLEVGDAHTADQIKAYLPAIRSNILMLLSHKSSAELLTLEGKEKLAREIKRESVRPMGIELDDEDEDPPPEGTKKKKKKKRHVESPVSNVLFSTFIVQ
ncbi:flagellar basal body rod protein [Paucibacter sp. KBW04]|uniref:flagellar basal body-associated FliL family protein n=1 Tax=Paucibacter sp. KBW04 TaxID=2153361 RepID=UPI000F56371C|nr:flagellar basal body-associated FliL family protein [Paucibacter sp. KBW04]RQO56429.1 flagellar basal body rod protein [Paucibacter sp. KBW04]